MVELFGCRGCGSAAIEALLEWSGVPYTSREVDPQDGASLEMLRAVNPLGQVPALRFADGTVVAESAAIMVTLAEQHPAARMLPAGGPARVQALRWIAYLAGNVYPAIGIEDFPERWVDAPEAQAALKAGSRARLEHYWSVMEHALVPAPYLVGHEMSALDVYAAMMSHWYPGSRWIDAHCPRLAAAIALTERQPFVKRAWERNFGGR